MPSFHRHLVGPVPPLHPRSGVGALQRLHDHYGGLAAAPQAPVRAVEAVHRPRGQRVEGSRGRGRGIPPQDRWDISSVETGVIQTPDVPSWFVRCGTSSQGLTF